MTRKHRNILTGVFGCAWHQKFTGRPLVFEGATGRALPMYAYEDVASHGICRECLAEVRARWRSAGHRSH